VLVAPRLSAETFRRAGLAAAAAVALVDQAGGLTEPARKSGQCPQPTAAAYRGTAAAVGTAPAKWVRVVE